jgi:O-antigen/teichoic acid export membrane protein
MKKILIKNSKYSILQAILSAILMLAAIPIFIKTLGSEEYGIFALVVVVGSLNTFTNLGLASALVKFIAVQGKTKESNIDIWVNFTIVGAVSFPLTIVAFYFDQFILLDLLKIPMHLLDEARLLYYWILAASFLLLIGQIFKSIIDALQKVHVTTLHQIFHTLLYWGLMILVLLLDKGLSEIGFSIFIAASIWLLISIISTFKIYGTIPFSGFISGFKHSAKKQLTYGLKIYSGGLINFLYEPLSKILLSHFFGVKEVGYFDIALRLKGQVLGIISKVFYPLFPFISKETNIATVRNYVHDLEQKTFLVVVPLIVIIIVLMQPFMSIWIGNDSEIIAFTSIALISFHLAFSSTVIPVYYYLMVKDQVNKTIIIQLVNALINILVFFLTFSLIGYYSIVVGNVVGIFISFLLCLHYQNKYLNSLIFDSFSQFYKLTLSFLILYISGLILNDLLNEIFALNFILIPIFIFLLAVILYKFFNLITSNDIYRYFGNKNKYALYVARLYGKN